ncbi:MAG TPA: hypothetical protein VM095_03215, partial [Pyrinomonadaceae bacterium]|nr:hypothetical protein [Pyrinomonadaceae bacterium]
MKRLSRGSVIILIVSCALVSLPFLYARASRTIIEPQQQRGRSTQPSRNRRRRPTTPTPGAQALTKGSSRNYSRFKHEDHRRPIARLDCAD